MGAAIAGNRREPGSRLVRVGRGLARLLRPAVGAQVDALPVGLGLFRKARRRVAGVDARARDAVHDPGSSRRGPSGPPGTSGGNRPCRRRRTEDRRRCCPRRSSRPGCRCSGGCIAWPKDSSDIQISFCQMMLFTIETSAERRAGRSGWPPGASRWACCHDRVVPDQGRAHPSS